MKTLQSLKAFNYDPKLTAPELSAAITEQAFNTSSLITNMGQHYTDNPNYRNVYVTHPSIMDATEGAVIPPSTVQSYSTTVADFVKVASSVELTNEVLSFSKFDIESNTAMLVGTVLSNEIANKAVANIATRFVDARTPLTQTEEVLRLKSGFVGEWGSDVRTVYEFLASAVKQIPDAYDADSKLFCNKSNFVDFASSITAEGEQVWLIQNGLLLGRYEVVICDQLDDNTMYFGSMMNAFDVVAMTGNQTIDEVTKPDVLKITETNKFAFTEKDTFALVAMTAEL
ncbi:hypothetical protein Q5H80_03070 [Vibrio sp. SNU_ST1]|uniref:phage major capsid family protein n=1 Tax=Vibrio sp. SNU_ST1 TaxID=3064001 RepID=UPI00272CE581|nr:phage major capsid protein [Vibrio sp. SNU_ST1]WKY58647.1 hypothetical protein Q5H80_03070 [Vibrio sp. SNU_ST1]